MYGAFSRLMPQAFLALAVLCCGATGQADEVHSAYEDLIHIVEVPLMDPADVDALSNAGMVVSDVQHTRATLYVFEEQLAQLRAMGFAPMPAKLLPPDEKHLSAYHTYDDMLTDLQAFADANPDITRLLSVGKSAQNRDLWVLLISDNPDLEEDEPEFRYLSTLHGDEKIGTELCLFLIDHLLNGYGTDPRVTDLINETEIWIMPLANPDGWVAHQRFNANGVDLNRNFPIFPSQFSGTIYDEELDISAKQIETQNIALWSAAQSFVLSANLHSGALVTNYPYDNIPGIPSGTNAPTDEDALMRALSRAYADHNAPMFNNPTFPGGIINGSDWYSITGGFQDWNYRYLACIDMTLELSNTKTPASNTVAQLWDDNQESMLSFMEEVHRGIRGLVLDRISNAPLWAIVNVNTSTQPAFTDPDVGDYHRILLPGTYTLTFNSENYIPYVVAGVEVIEGNATRQDVTLSNGDLNGDGLVNAVDVQLSVNALLGYNVPVDADVDGLGLSATDLQHIVNRSLGII